MMDNEIVSTTVSIGATLAQKKDTVESLINRAQKLMNHAKWLGRNRVAFTLELPLKEEEK